MQRLNIGSQDSTAAGKRYNAESIDGKSINSSLNVNQTVKSSNAEIQERQWNVGIPEVLRANG